MNSISQSHPSPRRCSASDGCLPRATLARHRPPVPVLAPPRLGPWAPLLVQLAAVAAAAAEGVAAAVAAAAVPLPVAVAQAAAAFPRAVQGAAARAAA